MDFWVMDDAKLLNILLDGVGLCVFITAGPSTRPFANGHTQAF